MSCVLHKLAVHLALPFESLTLRGLQTADSKRLSCVARERGEVTRPHHHITPCSVPFPPRRGPGQPQHEHMANDGAWSPPAWDPTRLPGHLMGARLDRSSRTFSMRDKRHSLRMPMRIMNGSSTDEYRTVQLYKYATIRESSFLAPLHPPPALKLATHLPICYRTDVTIVTSHPCHRLGHLHHLDIRRCDPTHMFLKQCILHL